MTKDYYKTLNINRDSSQDDIKKAFRKLSKQYHPDKGGNEDKFKEISEAYDTLSNPDKKRRYDMGGQNPFGGHNPFGQRGGGDMEDLFNQSPFLLLPWRRKSSFCTILVVSAVQLFIVVIISLSVKRSKSTGDFLIQRRLELLLLESVKTVDLW